MNTAVWAQECVAQFFAEIYALGLRHVVFCPGSRSTPLALVAARHGGFKLWQHIDERSAGYFGLGIAKWDRQPVVLVCTSGTAVANFAPAVVEAYTAGVPLLVCTADRPPELHGTGANQTIEQSGFFGKHVKLSIDLSVPDGSVEVRRSFRSTAQRAVAAAMNAVQGPVHLNFPFREPLVAPPMALPDQLDRAAGSIVTVAPLSIDSTALEPLASILRRADRGVIIVGEQHDPALASALMALARRLQFPVLADALSNLRNGPHYGPLLIDSYEALLRDPACTALLGPDVVVRCGAAPTAKSLLQLLEQARCPQIVLAEERWADPAATTTTIIRGRPAAICTALTGLLEGQQLSAKSSQWLQRWQSWQHTARRALTQETRCFADLFEGRVFVELNELMPEGGVIFAGNSMPVRDLDAFFGGSHRTVHLLANRGASGIDGVTSTALGVAAASGRPAVLVIGDLSFFHDMNGLLMAKRYGISLTIVLVQNDGGGIFSFLAQAGEETHFERLFGTPHGLDFSAVATIYGATYSRVETWATFGQAVSAGLRDGGLRIVELRTDRSRNVGQHRAVWQAVATAIAGEEQASWHATESTTSSSR